MRPTLGSNRTKTNRYDENPPLFAPEPAFGRLGRCPSFSFDAFSVDVDRSHCGYRGPRGRRGPGDGMGYRGPAFCFWFYINHQQRFLFLACFRTFLRDPSNACYRLFRSGLLGFGGLQ
jgi:hypothetical protein